MFKILDLKYYKVEVNDESKEIKCTQIVRYKKSNPSKKIHCLNFLNKYWIFCSCFEIESQSSIWLWW